ncbi:MULTISPECIES: hypothetical protein [Shewanella]|uniref:Pilus assembly protein PilP n=1 Tax=Shewanella marisflavi TaxID=260364 RepID=A0ABX5WJM6_9GAMM|nr:MULTISPECIES: hypothetical protein [Shewanella]QDF74670.1 hypothetical protein FGA12_05600 [Shewanella marisflavi]
MKRIVRIMIGLMPLTLLGCSLQAQDAALPDPVPAPVPAIVSEPSAESLTELENAIAKLLQMEKVTLAADAFTQNSRLALERSPHTDPNGQLLMGRNFELPQIVQLWISGDKCFVTDSEKHRSAPLTVTRCYPE